MSNMKTRLAMAMMVGAAMSDHPLKSTMYSGCDPIPIGPKPPGNSEEYCFNAAGECNNHHMLISDVVFRCYAINEKNAIRKFNNWKKKQP